MSLAMLDRLHTIFLLPFDGKSKVAREREINRSLLHKMTVTEDGGPGLVVAAIMGKMTKRLEVGGETEM